MTKVTILFVLLITTTWNYGQTSSNLYQKFNDSTMSVVERKDLFRQLSNTEKSEIWVEHLKTGFSRYDLTLREKAVLQKVIDAISPTLYELNMNLTIEELESEVEATFRYDIARALFGVLGDPDTAKCLVGQTRSIFVNAAYKPFSASPSCWCNIGSSFNFSCADVPNNDCGQGGGRIACIATEDGCGFLGFFSCNGSCVMA